MHLEAPENDPGKSSTVRAAAGNGQGRHGRSGTSGRSGGGEHPAYVRAGGILVLVNIVRISIGSLPPWTDVADATARWLF